MALTVALVSARFARNVLARLLGLTTRGTASAQPVTTPRRRPSWVITSAWVFLATVPAEVFAETPSPLPEGVTFDFLAGLDASCPSTLILFFHLLMSLWAGLWCFFHEYLKPIVIYHHAGPHTSACTCGLPNRPINTAGLLSLDWIFPFHRQVYRNFYVAAFCFLFHELRRDGLLGLHLSQLEPLVLYATFTFSMWNYLCGVSMRQEYLRARWQAPESPTANVLSAISFEFGSFLHRTGAYAFYNAVSRFFPFALGAWLCYALFGLTPLLGLHRTPVGFAILSVAQVLALKASRRAIKFALVRAGRPSCLTWSTEQAFELTMALFAFAVHVYAGFLHLACVCLVYSCDLAWLAHRAYRRRNDSDYEPQSETEDLIKVSARFAFASAMKKAAQLHGLPDNQCNLVWTLCFNFYHFRPGTTRAAVLEASANIANAVVDSFPESYSETFRAYIVATGYHFLGYIQRNSDHVSIGNRIVRACNRAARLRRDFDFREFVSNMDFGTPYEPQSESGKDAIRAKRRRRARSARKKRERQKRTPDDLYNNGKSIYSNRQRVKRRNRKERGGYEPQSEVDDFTALMAFLRKSNVALANLISLFCEATAMSVFGPRIASRDSVKSFAKYAVMLVTASGTVKAAATLYKLFKDNGAQCIVKRSLEPILVHLRPPETLEISRKVDLLLSWREYQEGTRKISLKDHLQECIVYLLDLRDQAVQHKSKHIAAEAGRLVEHVREEAALFKRDSVSHKPAFCMYFYGAAGIGKSTIMKKCYHTAFFILSDGQQDPNVRHLTTDKYFDGLDQADILVGADLDGTMVDPHNPPTWYTSVMSLGDEDRSTLRMADVNEKNRHILKAAVVAFSSNHETHRTHELRCDQDAFWRRWGAVYFCSADPRCVGSNGKFDHHLFAAARVNDPGMLGVIVQPMIPNQEELDKRTSGIESGLFVPHPDHGPITQTKDLAEHLKACIDVHNDRAKASSANARRKGLQCHSCGTFESSCECRSGLNETLEFIESFASIETLRPGFWQNLPVTWKEVDYVPESYTDYLQAPAAAGASGLAWGVGFAFSAYATANALLGVARVRLSRMFHAAAEAAEERACSAAEKVTEAASARAEGAADRLLQRFTSSLGRATTSFFDLVQDRFDNLYARVALKAVTARYQVAITFATFVFVTVSVGAFASAYLRSDKYVPQSEIYAEPSTVHVAGKPNANYGAVPASTSSYLPFHTPPKEYRFTDFYSTHEWTKFPYLKSGTSATDKTFSSVLTRVMRMMVRVTVKFRDCNDNGTDETPVKVSKTYAFATPAGLILTHHFFYFDLLGRDDDKEFLVTTEGAFDGCEGLKSACIYTTAQIRRSLHHMGGECVIFDYVNIHVAQELSIISDIPDNYFCTTLEAYVHTRPDGATADDIKNYSLVSRVIEPTTKSVKGTESPAIGWLVHDTRTGPGDCVLPVIARRTGSSEWFLAGFHYGYDQKKNYGVIQSLTKTLVSSRLGTDRALRANQFAYALRDAGVDVSPEYEVTTSPFASYIAGCKAKDLHPKSAAPNVPKACVFLDGSATTDSSTKKKWSTSYADYYHTEHFQRALADVGGGAVYSAPPASVAKVVTHLDGTRTYHSPLIAYLQNTIPGNAVIHLSALEASTVALCMEFRAVQQRVHGNEQPRALTINEVLKSSAEHGVNGPDYSTSVGPPFVQGKVLFTAKSIKPGEREPSGIVVNRTVVDHAEAVLECVKAGKAFTVLSDVALKDEPIKLKKLERCAIRPIQNLPWSFNLVGKCYLQPLIDIVNREPSLGIPLNVDRLSQDWVSRAHAKFKDKVLYCGDVVAMDTNFRCPIQQAICNVVAVCCRPEDRRAAFAVSVSSFELLSVFLGERCFMPTVNATGGFGTMIWNILAQKLSLYYSAVRAGLLQELLRGLSAEFIGDDSIVGLPQSLVDKGFDGEYLRLRYEELGFAWVDPGDKVSAPRPCEFEALEFCSREPVDHPELGCVVWALKADRLFRMLSFRKSKTKFTPAEEAHFLEDALFEASLRGRPFFDRVVEAVRPARLGLSVRWSYDHSLDVYRRRYLTRE